MKINFIVIYTITKQYNSILNAIENVLNNKVYYILQK